MSRLIGYSLDVVQSEYSVDVSIEQAAALSNKAIEKALGERPVVGIRLISVKDSHRFQKLT